MLINNIDLSSLDIMLYDRVLSSNSIDTTEEWLDGDIQPTFVRQQDRFKSMKLSFLVLTSDEHEAFIKISKLTSMLKKAELQFDDLDLTFSVTMQGKAQEDRLKNGNFIVTYTFNSDYAKGERETYTTDANATNSFKLTVLYYQNATTLLSQESVTIRAGSFIGVGDTLDSIGVKVNKYQPEYYNEGIATNLGGQLTYEALSALKTLIINYEPIKYNLQVNYYIDDGTGTYKDLVSQAMSFTYPRLQQITTIGQLIDTKTFKPENCIAKIDYTGELTIDALLKASPISVYYDKIEKPLETDVAIVYQYEDDNGDFTDITTAILHFRETDFTDGLTLENIIQRDAYIPSSAYYNTGVIEGLDPTTLVSFDSLATTYVVKYSKKINTIFVEYYLGVYPNWYRLTSLPVQTKYYNKYEKEFALSDLNIDFDKYKTATYKNGKLNSSGSFETYQEVLNIGVIQIYYEPIDFPLVVRYYKETTISEPLAEVNLIINELTFINNPVLNDIVNITQYRPEGYQFDSAASYTGEISLAAMTQASPINIIYKEIAQLQTKNIIVKYKQELASAFSVINTSLLTINEADCADGIRLKDIINLNAYKPDYYESGIIDGASSTALITFDGLASSYEVAYLASTYTTPVRYFVDSVEETNWIGSSAISYKVISFAVDTTLYDLGLNLNAYKPSYCGDGELKYTGPINFAALKDLEAINVVYTKQSEPEDPDGIDYPHRFLFLQHNDLGSYEHLHPTWTMNHAYINTGVTVDDMSKLTVVMECGLVDKNVPLHEVIAGYGYLFGSSSQLGEYYMRFNNQTQYGNNLTGTNTYEARAGKDTNKLTLTEEAAVGFSANTGIYASDRAGYSYATFTYTNNLQSENAAMPYPLYLFANNSNGQYADGIAGVGIYSCRIYYNNVLIRDMIPVQFYDKIGSLVAPSNCLYDKVSKTFFEDGTKQNSFNIIDDERYEDTNLEHKIGHCYVNYYKDDQIFQTATIWFRGNDFSEPWDLYEHLLVDNYQPTYYKSGVITNADEVPVINFDNLNNKIFNVVYEAEQNFIVVNYYKDVADETHLLKTENISITEKDFYQAPTFGDIVRLNKYRPDGYETNFTFTGKKVSYGRVLENSPYNIVYTPSEDTSEYTTTIKYIKRVFGIRAYKTVAEETLTLKGPQFRDGEYIDYFIDFNKHKPEKFYVDGVPFDWYTMDERISTPQMLKSEYTVVYQPEEIGIDINYYVNSVADENKIASKTWNIMISEFEGEFQIVDELPNNYMNQFKPVNCTGGVFEDPSKTFTFETLAEQGYINIIYARIFEPDDPETAEYEQKVLYWGNLTNTLFLSGDKTITQDPWNDPDLFGFEDDHSYIGGRIPWIDLGYNTKDLSRLRVEIKAAVASEGFISSSVTPYAFQTKDYNYYFGYLGPRGVETLGTLNALGAAQERPTYTEFWSGGSSFSPTAAGGFGLCGRIPVASGYVYTQEGPQYLDGQIWYHFEMGSTIKSEPDLKYLGMSGRFRKGYYQSTNDNWEEYQMNDNYAITSSFAKFPGENNCYFNKEAPHLKLTGKKVENGGIVSKDLTALDGPMAIPFYITLDAYNNYGSIYTDFNTNTPDVINFDLSADDDSFEGRPQVKGTISLFQTTNPATGKVNVMPFRFITYPDVGTYAGSMSLMNASNPYSSDYKTNVTTTQLVITGQDSQGNPIYENKSQSRNILFANFNVPIFPQMSGCAVWSLKLYDRDRLVRDLIPVAKGDKIYNYTMPANGLFDLVTEIFFGNSNEGGEYEGYGAIAPSSGGTSDKTGASLNQTKLQRSIPAKTVYPLRVMKDPLLEGKITVNYYDQNNNFLDNQWVDVPTWLHIHDNPIEDILRFNDYKPDSFHLDGMLDLDKDLSWEKMSLADIAEMGTANVYYKLKTFTKTVVYYRDNVRIGSKDLFYSLADIQKAQTLDDLGIDKDLYYSEDFAHGEIVFDESIIASHDLKKFIDAPAPIVVYKKLTKKEAPNKFYVSYYRGGAYNDERISYNPDDPNYLTCNLDAVVLNPNGAIKYTNHYHSALYEDEEFDYFIPYQVRVVNKYAGIHKGPGRKYMTLAMIIEEDTYTIIEERNGWGRLKEYSKGWVDLNATEKMYGPGQNPKYDTPDDQVATIAFGTRIHLSKLTVDRLWAYCPEQESWVKAEEISYDQAGKLYNGLDIQVIDLSTIDWSNAASLTDLGIYPQAKKLHYHDFASYEYDGEYTLEAFQNLHELEFVYPETVYNINCIYYKEILDQEENELGRAAISFSMSDWNPDWDTFIETSYQIDEYGHEIPPTMYRDTELVLDWNYYGIERNLYKPTGYGDGIFIWNPRTWDKTNVKFTFTELIQVGTQKILYPSVEVGMFKAYDEATAGDSLNAATLFNSDFYFCRADDLSESAAFVYDVNVETEKLKEIKYQNEDVDYCYFLRNYFSNYHKPGKILSPAIYYYRGRYNLNIEVTSVSADSVGGWRINSFKPESPDDLVSINFSNKRETGQVIYGQQNATTKEIKFFDQSGKMLDDTTNLKELPDLITTAYIPSGTKTYYTSLKNAKFRRPDDFSTSGYLAGPTGIVRDIQYYKNFNMTRYWTPMPKGMRYFNGTEWVQFSENGYYDIINHEFQPVSTMKLFLANDMEQKKIYNYFEGKEFDYDEVNYVTKMNQEQVSYEYPDVLSTKSNTLQKNLVVPVSKVTADAAHNILGEWYATGPQWFLSSSASLSTLSNGTVVPIKQTVAYMAEYGPQQTDQYLNPETKAKVDDEYFGAESITPVYYEYTPKTDGDAMYFNGIFWLRKSNTSGATVTSNKNYVVSVKTLTCYKYPKNKTNEFAVDTYYQGDRVTVLYTTEADPNWGYTGRGWVQISDNLSEVN